MPHRMRKVWEVFGIRYGVKYLFVHWLHKHCYIKLIGKRLVKLMYKNHLLYVRMFSRDLDFVEDIYIGNAWEDYGGAYNLQEDGDCNSFIDLGANIGLFSFMYAVKYPERKIIAVEPEMNNFTVLKRNMQNFNNVICLKNAVWFRDAKVKVNESTYLVYPSNTPTEGGFYVSECGKNDTEGICAITINDLVKKYKLKDYLVKMDIEGAEYAIFENGNCEWLNACKTFVIETHDRFSNDNDENEIFAVLKNTHKLKKTLGENKVFIRRSEWNSMPDNELEKIYDMILHNNNVFLYGKGKVGKLFLQWLQLCQMDYIKGFVVSNLENEERMCVNKPVLEAKQLKTDYPESVIIVCVTKLFRQEIIGNLQKLKWTNYIVLSDELIEKCSKNIARLRPRTALKFEVHITEHCNLNCRGCFHCSPLAKKEFLSIEEYEKDCRRLSELFQENVECIELLGGEPLLHPQITEFFRITRTCFEKGRIVLVTNGILLLSMKEEFWIAAQKYRIDFAPTHYPIKVDYTAIQKKAESFGLKYSPFSMKTDEQGNKILENFHFDITGNQSEIKNFYRCYRGNYCISLKHGRLYSCVIGANLYHFKEYFGLKQIEIPENDGIDIHSVKSADEIAEFLTKPMHVCKYCNLVAERSYIPFQRSEKKMEEWL